MAYEGSKNKLDLIYHNIENYNSIQKNLEKVREGMTIPPTKLERKLSIGNAKSAGNLKLHARKILSKE